MNTGKNCTSLFLQ